MPTAEPVSSQKENVEAHVPDLTAHKSPQPLPEAQTVSSADENIINTPPIRKSPKGHTRPLAGKDAAPALSKQPFGTELPPGGYWTDKPEPLIPSNGNFFNADGTWTEPGAHKDQDKLHGFGGMPPSAAVYGDPRTKMNTKSVYSTLYHPDLKAPKADDAPITDEFLGIGNYDGTAGAPPSSPSTPPSPKENVRKKATGFVDYEVPKVPEKRVRKPTAPAYAPIEPSKARATAAKAPKTAPSKQVSTDSCQTCGKFETKKNPLYICDLCDEFWHEACTDVPISPGDQPWFCYVCKDFPAAEALLEKWQKQQTQSNSGEQKDTGKQSESKTTEKPWSFDAYLEELRLENEAAGVPETEGLEDDPIVNTPKPGTIKTPQWLIDQLKPRKAVKQTARAIEDEDLEDEGYHSADTLENNESSTIEVEIEEGDKSYTGQVCEVCHIDERDDLALICAGCDKLYHNYCIGEKKPPGKLPDIGLAKLVLRRRQNLQRKTSRRSVYRLRQNHESVRSTTMRSRSYQSSRFESVASLHSQKSRKLQLLHASERCTTTKVKKVNLCASVLSHLSQRPQKLHILHESEKRKTMRLRTKSSPRESELSQNQHNQRRLRNSRRNNPSSQTKSHNLALPKSPKFLLPLESGSVLLRTTMKLPI